ncbi:hypothetical protein BJX99DRAFT_262204 [Aspergillus californicus]
MPIGQHHCPVCWKSFKFRCAQKNHMSPCPVHPEYFVWSRNSCAACDAARKAAATRLAATKKAEKVKGTKKGKKS